MNQLPPTTQQLLQRAVWLHVVLVASKLALGFMTGAVSLIAAGIHSGIDMICAAATATAERQKGTLAETLRQYGEAQADHILAVMEGLLIFIISLVIMYESIQRAAVPHIVAGTLPYAMVVMVAATLCYTFLAQRFQTAVKRQPSPALAASADQARLDVWSSAAFVTGLAVMEITGWHWLDAVLACAVSLRMMYMAAIIVKTHYAGFTYIPLSQMEENRIGRIILDTPGVAGYHNLHVKPAKDTLKVCFHLEIPRDLPTYQAAAVSDAVSLSLVLHYGPCIPSIHIDRT